MSYVDAGYSIGLSVLFLYSVSLVVRARRLRRAQPTERDSRSA